MTRRGMPGLLLCFLLLQILVPAAAQSAARTVRVGVYDNPPKIFLDKQGHLSGILGDLLTRIAKQSGWQIQPVACHWQDCLDMLQSGQIDLMPDVAYSKPRTRLMDFSKVPALHSWSQFYTRRGLNLKSIKALQGRRILVLAGSVQESYLSKMIADFGIHAELVPVDSLNEGFKRVADGKADVVVANRFFGNAQAKQFHLKQSPIMVQPVRIFYATGKGRNAALLKTIDEFLRRWQGNPDSYYYLTLWRWHVQAPKSPIPSYVWWGIGLLGLSLLLAMAVAVVFRHQVRVRTESLRASEDRLSVILNSVDAYIFIKGTDLRYQYVNRKVSDLFGLPPEQIVGRGDEAFFDAPTAAALKETDRRVFERGERVAGEEVNRRHDGQEERIYLTVKLPLRDRDDRIYALCGIATDITEHKQNLARIHQLAFYDSLTGLANRRLLQDRLDHAVELYASSHSEGALLFIDLDNFKVLNDTLGHAVGDELLQQVAERLLVHARPNDTLARLGGDEFVLMQENLGSTHRAVAHTENTAAELVQALAAPYALEGRNYSITASIGIALFSDADSRAGELLKRADMAMYEAKSGGRNGLRFFNPEMQAVMLRRVELEADLRTALEQHQFALYYQPQVDDECRLLGFEALVRWKHPAKGVLLPAEFIPVAESTGLILPLGHWIVRSACEQLLEWADDPEHAERYIAVNVSAEQFRHPDFVDDMLHILDDTGVDSSRLELELTESQLIEDIEATIEKMLALRARGVRFSLDDFGTGYSSLSYLKRLPLDQLKIDQTFVRDVLTDPNDAAIIRTIIALGASLDLAVIAEGVETAEQRDALIGFGCRRMQGFLFGHPAPADRLTE